jgi:hypothetical protein
MNGPFSQESLAFMVPILLVSVFMVLPLVVRQLKRLRRAEGTVISSEARRVDSRDGSEGYIPVITYQYRFNGRDYTGTTESTSDPSQGSMMTRLWATPMARSAAEMVCSRFTPGSPCTVYPDLSDHSRSTLRMATPASQRSILLAVIAAATAILVAGLFMILNVQSGQK